MTSIDLLIIGLGPSWRILQKSIQEKLTEEGYDSRVTAFDLHSFEWIEEKVEERATLDIVIIGDYDMELKFTDVMQGCEKLALALAKHPNHPWVCFLDPRLEILDKPLKEAGVEVSTDLNEIIHKRVKLKAETLAAT